MLWKQFFTPVRSLNVDEARAFLADTSPDEVTILDVRQPGEYEEGHLPGAKLAPLPKLNESLEGVDPSKPVMVYCAIGGRSRVAAQTLAGKGFTQVLNMSGGFKAWTGKAAYGDPDTGLALFTGALDTERILATAYSLEDGLRDFYIKMLEKVRDEKVRGVFELLAEIEIKHKDRIFAEYVRLTGNNDQAAFESVVVTPLLEGGLTTEQYLERFQPDLERPADVISLAMSIEAQALDLYTRAADAATNQEHREVLTQIAREEQTHLIRLGELLDDVLENN